jgi:uncharacterized protein (UPF0276 family)
VVVAVAVVEPVAVGLAWRPQLADVCRATTRFTEVVAEQIDPRAVPTALRALVAGGVPVAVHGVGLGLGNASRPERKRLASLRRVAHALDAAIVSEHLAFVRAGGREAGHLLPVPRNRSALRVVAENVRIFRDAMDGPVAVEHPAALFDWPDGELTRADFLAEVVLATDCGIVLDVANLVADMHNFGLDPIAFLDRIPLERVAYVHVAGGVRVNGRVHDTHAHRVLPETFALLETVLERCRPAGVVLERDDHLSGRLIAEEVLPDLESLGATVERGAARRRGSPPPALVVRGEQPSRRDRHALATRQDALLAALLGQGPCPPGLDPAALAAAGSQLMRKHARRYTTTSNSQSPGTPLSA